MATHRRRPTRRGLTPARNEAALDLIVAWHETPIGHLTHDGFEWRWKAVDEKGPPLVRRTTPGQLPTFIVSLLPEGWLESVLGDRDERAQLRSGRRYMSNIMIALSPKELAAVPADILDTRLAYIEGGTFTGRYEDPWPWRAGKQLEANLAAIFARNDTPRLSGTQIKAPMYLASDGALLPSVCRPFTHILKPAGTSGFDILPVIEWQALTLGAVAGFETLPPWHSSPCRTCRRL